MPKLSKPTPDQQPTRWQEFKVRQMLRNGHSIGAAANLTRLSFVTVINIKSKMKPPRLPTRRISPSKCKAIRSGRRAGRTVAGLAKDYGLTRDEVLSILRTTPRRNSFDDGRNAMVAEGYSDEQIRAVFGK
jgi:hypothetical protein